MKLGSLFSGSGGFELAGAIYGITPAWASEIEPYPIKVTKARFPGMKHLGSVLDVDGGKVEPVDIITFGSPCQDLSVAGKQAGLHKGERSNLFFEAIRIIKEMREATNGTYPRIAIWENVPGAYSSNKGEDFRAVLKAFCQVCDPTADVHMPPKKWHKSGAIVGNGWSVAWRTFDAQYWGVPQRRKRIYLIADFGSERAGKVLFEQDRVPRDYAACGEAGQGATGDAEGSVGGGCVGFDHNTSMRNGMFAFDEQANTLRVGGAGGGVCYAFQACGDRDNQNISVSDKAYCLPANPMSDRGQAICFKERAGCPGGGKGILCGDKPFTLSTLTDQAVCYATAFMGGQGDKARSIAWTEEATPPLKAVLSGSNTVPDVCYAVRTAQTNANGIGVAQDAHALDGANAQAVRYSVDCRNMNLTKEHGTLQAKENGGQSLNYMGAVCYPVENHPNDSRISIREDGIVPTLSSHMGTGGNNGPMVLYTKQKIGHYCELKVASTQQARQYKSADDLVVSSAKPPRKYIIRRLTPLECCRLQGFPDCWCSGIENENPTEEEIAFWSVVWETHRTAMEKSGKPKSRNQIIKWLRDPRSDSSEYKMWGNGIALPNAAHVIGCAKKLIGGRRNDPVR